jgi:hypothetical protein
MAGRYTFVTIANLLSVDGICAVFLEHPAKMAFRSGRCCDHMCCTMGNAPVDTRTLFGCPAPPQ